MSYHYYASFKGTKQGSLKGKPSRGRHWIEVTSFNYGTASPRDSSSGGATGKRGHDPVVITKEIDSASPKLFQAHWAAEIFDEIVIEKTTSPHPGLGRIAQRITLTNASISSLKIYAGKSRGTGRDLSELELRARDIRLEDFS